MSSGRSKGSGSIEQRSQGSWRIRYSGPVGPNGKRNQITETVKGGKKIAEKRLRDRLAAIDTGAYVPKHKETVGEFIERWLDTYAATNTTLRTLHGYRGYVKRYVGPSIGNIPLQSLTTQQVQTVYADMLQRGLSNTTVVQLHRILKQALGHGVKWGILARNVADATSPPRIQRPPMDMWDVDTVHRFLDAAEDSRFRDLHHLAVLTGLRRSEICGLKWDQVDLARGRISVVATLQRITGHGLVQGQPKTARSRRSVPLDPTGVNVLHSVRGRQMELQLAAGPSWQNLGYVFTHADGSPVAPDMVSKDFCAIVRKEGLPNLTFHGLRHATATLLLTLGVNLKVVSEILGHSNIAITADTYSHVLPGLQEQAVLALGQLLVRDKQPGINYQGNLVT